MAAVDSESANWRLFGGGGLALAGLIGTIGAIVEFVAPGPVLAWIFGVFLLLVGVALLFVAFGQTGSNGAVGNSVFGKVALLVYAAGWILGALFVLLGFGLELFEVSAPLLWVFAILIVVGGLLSAVAIFQKGVARGVAKWALFVPAIFGIVYVLSGLVFPAQAWIDLVQAVLILLLGVVYLFNRK